MGVFMRVPAVMVFVCLALLPAAGWARQPSGDGDPAETRCMKGDDVTGSKLGTRMVCKTNAEWAQLKKDGVVLNPDGSIARPDNDPREVGAHGCFRTSSGGPGTDGTRAFNFQCH
jgi:hypothetical protein